MRIALLGPISTAGIAPFLHSPPPHDFPPGVKGAPFMEVLIKALIDRGHEVFAMTSGGFEATRDSQPLSTKGERFEFFCCPSRRHSFRPSHGRVGRMVDFYGYERANLTRLLEYVKPDFVHAHWSYEYALAAIDCRLPHLVTAHDDPLVVLKLFRNLFRLGRYFMARKALSRASALSAVSPVLQERLKVYSRTPIDVIPNPLSKDFLGIGKPREMLQSEMAPRFISVANGWVRLKNVETALKAFALIRRQIPCATYHLFGMHYEEGGPAHKWAKEMGLSEAVNFCGPVAHAQLIEELMRSTVMLHPSRWESCPMGIAEALSMGLPVVGGKNSGGVAWMIGEGGRVVDINNATAITSAALEILSDPEVYQRCSVAAIERVKAFSPEFIAAQYEEKYVAAMNACRGSA